MAESTFVLYDGDGSTAEFTYPFEVLGAFSDVIVKVKNDGDVGFVTQVEDTDYTLDTDSKTVTFLSGSIPDAGTQNVRIERFTNRDREIDFAGGGSIAESDLDNDANRLTSVTQEIEDGIVDALRKHADGLRWDAEGFRISNGSPATEATDYVTLAQLFALVDGDEVATIDVTTVFTFTGDGVTDTFELDDWKGLATASVWIFIDQVKQKSDGTVYTVSNAGDSDYPSEGTQYDFVVFDTPPEPSAEIEILIISGTVQTRVEDDGVDTDQIADDAVGEDQINVGSGDAKRFLVIDASGDPTARTIGPADFAATGQTPSGSFNTAVRTSRLDQMAAPTANVDMNNVRLTNVSGPSVGSDAATKTYVDNAIPRAKFSTGTLGNIGTATSRTKSLGWRPDMVVIQAQAIGAIKECSWTCVFGGSNGPFQIVGGIYDGGGGALIGPSMEFTRSTTGFTVVLDNAQDGDDPVLSCRYWAMKV